MILYSFAVQAYEDSAGYGYLSENASFADNVRKAGIIFVGPQGESIRTIGDKASFFSLAYLVSRTADGSTKGCVQKVLGRSRQRHRAARSRLLWR